MVTSPHHRPLAALTPRERAEELVGGMTLAQKIAQLHGAMETIDIYAVSADAAGSEGVLDDAADQFRIERHVAAIDELGIPRFRITNGPVGVGMGDGTPSPPATSLPMTIGLAAGFDPALARAYGDIIGSEAATLGQHVLEAPGLCLHRTTIAGRNFEYFSEDPYLSGVMGVEITKAIQAHDVIAMAKHFVLNDQEYERFRASIEIDEHVMRELYLLPFEMVVKDAGLAALMSAYNRIRGVYATEYRHTLTDILRTEWGFDGYVQSDFWSTRSAAASLNAGLDHEMPDAKWLNRMNVEAALSDTSLEIETVDRALVRRYAQMFRFGQFDRPYDPGQIDAARHGAIARTLGGQIAVLLKNDGGLLPLEAHTGSITIIGQSAFIDDATLGGGGSSKVDPLYTVRPLEGMQDVLAGLGSEATVTKVTVANDLSNLDQAKQAVADADAVVIMAGLVATEGADQKSPTLTHDQDRMLTELLGINPATVVVLKDGNPVLMPWIDQAPAVLEVWNQGSEDGHVVADLLFGVVNPSGKLPTTYPRSADDTLYAGHPERYPGTDEGDGYPVIRYSEGLQMGYRWFQSQGIRPLFGFGFGLSYTTFELSDVSIDAPGGVDASVTVTATVTNTGDVAGAEVVQVYVGIPANGQPPKRLVGFQKASMEAGQSQSVTITIDPAASHHPFGVWDYCSHSFQTVPGEYTVYVGTSADDTPHSAIVGRERAVDAQHRRDRVRGAAIDSIAARPAEPPRAGLPDDIVFVHGLAMSNRYLRPVVRMLASDRRAFAPSLPGVGRSSRSSRRPTMAELADGLVDWMDVVGVQRAVLVGHSLGCVVAAEMAARHPKRVRAVILVSPAEPRPWLQSAWRLAVDGTRERWSLIPIAVSDYFRVGAIRMLRTLSEARRSNSEGILGRIAQPTLVVRGGRDPLMSAEWAQSLTSALPAGRLTTLPGAPHAVVYSSVEQFVPIVRAFTATCSRTTAEPA